MLPESHIPLLLYTAALYQTNDLRRLRNLRSAGQRNPLTEMVENWVTVMAARKVVSGLHHRWPPHTQPLSHEGRGGLK